MADLKRILAGEGENYILPFLWLRDQSEEVLRTEMEKIYNCKIRAVCLESRPHPDFGGRAGGAILISCWRKRKRGG